MAKSKRAPTGTPSGAIDWTGVRIQRVEYEPAATIFAQGNPATEDLLDQLFNSTEKRLARTLLLLARYGEPEASHRTFPKVSQEVLAEMVGTTRSRVNFFMNKFGSSGSSITTAH